MVVGHNMSVAANASGRTGLIINRPFLVLWVEDSYPLLGLPEDNIRVMKPKVTLLSVSTYLLRK